MPTNWLDLAKRTPLMLHRCHTHFIRISQSYINDRPFCLSLFRQSTLADSGIHLLKIVIARVRLYDLWYCKVFEIYLVIWRQNKEHSVYSTLKFGRNSNWVFWLPRLSRVRRELGGWKLRQSKVDPWLPNLSQREAFVHLHWYSNDKFERLKWDALFWQFGLTYGIGSKMVVIKMSSPALPFDSL